MIRRIYRLESLDPLLVTLKRDGAARWRRPNASAGQLWLGRADRAARLPLPTNLITHSSAKNGLVVVMFRRHHQSLVLVACHQRSFPTKCDDARTRQRPACCGDVKEGVSDIGDGLIGDNRTNEHRSQATSTCLLSSCDALIVC
jgi:hypothetical protein